MDKIPPSIARTLLFAFVMALITLALSFAALIFAFEAGGKEVAWSLLLAGFLGAITSTCMLLYTKKRILSLRIRPPSVVTTIECRKCGFKSVREFQRGDYIFKEVEQCGKCNERMLVTAIYREVKEKRKETFRF